MMVKKTLVILCGALLALSYTTMGQTKQKKYGVVETKGNRVIPLLYNSIKPVKNAGVTEGYIVSQTTLADTLYSIDKNRLDTLCYHTNAPYYDAGKEWAPAKNLYGYINPQGKAIIPLKYDFVNTVNSTNVEVGFIVSNNQKDALFSSKGKRLTGFDYERMYRNYTQEPAILVKKNGMYSYLNLEGKEIATKKFAKASPFYLGTAVVSLQQKQGAIDASGHYVLEPKYDFVERLKTEKPLFKVKIGDVYGVVGAKDKVIIPVAYAKITPVNHTQIPAGFIVEKGKKNALFSSKGKPLTGFDYLFIIPNNIKVWADSNGYSYNYLYSPDKYSSKRILARKKDKYGYLDFHGKGVIPFVYTEAGNFRGGWAKVKKRGVSFAIDEAGVKHRKEDVFFINECYSEPPDGFSRFYKNMYKKMRYPAEAKKRGIKGEVHIQFVAEKDGTLTNPKVLQGLGYGCDEEAIRLIKTARKWRPGCHRGIHKRASHTINILFVPSKDQSEQR